MGTDTTTKVLLGVIAAGIWTLVVLQVRTTATLNAMAAEVQAIGLDTEDIHGHLDSGEAQGEDGETERMHFRIR